jgi:predicted transcriptional regulator
MSEKISFRLDDEHSKKLMLLAKKHKKSEHIIAREFLIAAVNDPETSVKTTIEGFETSIISLAAQIDEIKAYQLWLGSCLAKSIEIFLLHLGNADPEDVSEVVKEIFDG